MKTPRKTGTYDDTNIISGRFEAPNAIQAIAAMVGNTGPQSIAFPYGKPVIASNQLYWGSMDHDLDLPEIVGTRSFSISRISLPKDIDGIWITRNKKARNINNRIAKKIK